MKTKRLFHLATTTIGLLAATTLVGCSDGEPIELVQTAPQGIQGGALDSGDTNVFGVAHVTGNGFGGCTGSLLSENVVLTAIHCVASTPSTVDCPSQIFSIHPATEMYVTSKTSFSQNINDYHGVREVVVPPGDGLCGRDVAILILDAPVSGAEAVPLIPRLTPLQADEIYSAVGYGEQGEGGPSGTRMRRDNLSVLCVGSSCGAPDFVYPAEWVGETGICSGDSGGPALDSQSQVTGVTSRGAAGCDQPVYGNVYTHLDWIKATTVYAAQTSGLTPPSWATDTPGTGAGGGGPGGGGGVGGGGVGGGSAGTSGFVAGDLEDQKIRGDIQSSCAASPTPERAPRWTIIALAAAGLALLRRPSSRSRSR